MASVSRPKNSAFEPPARKDGGLEATATAVRTKSGSRTGLACGSRLRDPAGAAGNEVPIGRVEDGVVEGIEEIDSEVHRLLLAEGKLLVQRDIHQWHSVVTKRRPRRITQGSARGLVAEIGTLAQTAVVDRSDEGTGFEPSIDATFTLPQVALTDPIRE